MAQPTRSTLTGTVSWSDGSLFDGYLYLGLVLPQNSDGQWPTITLSGLPGPQRLPIWTEIPITAGVIDTSTRVWRTSTLSPPNSQYVAYWHDLNRRRIYPATGVSPTPFTLTVDPYAISIPTLTIPSVSATLPTPQDSTTSGV